MIQSSEIDQDELDARIDRGGCEKASQFAFSIVQPSVNGQYHDIGSFLHKQVLAGLNSAMTVRSYRDLGFEFPTSEKA